MNIASFQVVAIVIICALIGYVVKTSKLDNKWIPAICGGSGMIIGLVAFALGMPDFPAADWITAAAVGIASGLAATGAHEVYAQLFKE